VDNLSGTGIFLLGGVTVMVMVMDPNWDAVVERLVPTLGRTNVDLWIRTLQCVSTTDQIFKLTSPNEFHRGHVMAHYGEALQSAIQAIAVGFGFEISVVAPVDEPLSALPPPPVPASQLETPGRPQLHPLLNASYTFDSFVVGTSNQVAHASAQSVSENLGTAFNPLFLVGDAGLGKTHLLHSIGHAVHKANPKLRIHCLPAERFQNELVNAIQHARLPAFKDKYRLECDLLLIDDIHSVEGKERTQEEFFHIFNFLHESKSQIVLTSDKYPKDMPLLEQRLRSRFEWGLIADIQPPDMETRLAIIRKKAVLDRMVLPDDVALFLASLPTRSVRDLEGCLTRLRAFSHIEKKPIDMDFAQKKLASLMDGPKVVNIDDVMKTIADYHRVKVQELKSASRKAALTEPRHVAMYITRELTDLSFPEIGKRFGGRNHATVMNACDRVKERMLTDAQFAATVALLTKACLK
jgi:chromosomal replication initiator protein